MSLKVQKNFKTVYLSGEESSVEDLILDLQNEYPEWFVFNVEKTGGSTVRATLVCIEDNKEEA